MPLTLSSPAFADGAPIPSKYTCDGENVSPPLAWEDAPDETKCFALICDDPDAPRGTFVHWVLYALPGSATELPERLPTTPRLEIGARQGKNSAGKVGYMGPCPPGGTHRYFFTLYALDGVPELPAEPSKEQLLAAIRSHILADAQTMGTYQRSGRGR